MLCATEEHASLRCVLREIREICVRNIFCVVSLFSVLISCVQNFKERREIKKTPATTFVVITGAKVRGIF